MNRKVILWSVLVIGVLMIVAPFAMQLPSKAAAGERMMGDFQPIMAPANVQKTADYYYKVFVPLGQVAPAFNQQTVDKFKGYMAGLSQIPPSQLPPAMQKALPAMAKDFTQLITLMEQNVPIFEQVPAGLAHYKPLVTTMQGNVDDYASVNSLPSFNLFTWFFVVPGILLVLLSGWGLWLERGEKTLAVRPTPAH